MVGIYKITNKLNNKTYIGQSVCIERRWEEHIRDNSNSLIHLAILKYGVKNFTFEVLEECHQSELDEKEIYWIKVFNSFEDGYNLTLGGRGAVHYDIEKVYEVYLQCKSISETAKRIGCHKSTARNILRIFDIDHKEMGIEKPIQQINPITLEIIQTYNCITDAAIAMNVSHSAITKSLTDSNKTCAGYYWQLVDAPRNFISKKPKMWQIKVQQIDKETGEILNTFNSAADAAEFIGKDRKNGGSAISAVCNGKKKSAFGYKWKRLN